MLLDRGDNGWLERLYEDVVVKKAVMKTV